MRRLFIVICCVLPSSVWAQACFDPAQCAREALMRSAALERQLSLLDNELRALRADRNALAADVSALRKQLSETSRRMEALERSNAEMRKTLGLDDETGGE